MSFRPLRRLPKRVKEMVRGSGLEILVRKAKRPAQCLCGFGAGNRRLGNCGAGIAIAVFQHIVAYKVSPFSALLVRHFLHIQFVNLSNILLGREIIPELLQERCISGNILSYMKNILEHGDWYDKQKEGFKKVRAILGMGEQTPSENAADVILSLIKK